jgi:protein phosphatase
MEAAPGVSSAHAELDDYSWALLSHPGKLRSDNEDSVGAYAPTERSERGALFVVADGMGGHAAGEVASRLAVESVLQSWVASSATRPHQALRGAVRAANMAVFSASLDRDTHGMGTTCVCLAVVDGEAIVANVGDSRCYLVRRRQCSQITADHSRVGEMVRMRLLTPEQAASHPARSQLTRSLGGEPGVQVDLFRNPLLPGDGFVLCSDGVWDLVSRKEIADSMALPIANDTAHRLVELALERGAPDNVTALVVHLSKDLKVEASDDTASRGSFLGSLRDRFAGRGVLHAPEVIEDEPES